jgi:2-methylcitrate dehydratase PrpD
VGVALGGASEPSASLLSDYVKQTEARREASVIGKRFRTSTELAAWVNGTSGHALDFDDTDSIAAGYNMHHSVSILPALLALGEKCGASGLEILASYIVGFEVQAKLGGIIGARCSEQGWHPTSVLGTMASAAACGRVLKLSAGQIRMALGIAASLSNGVMRNSGTMTKPMHAGNAARQGVVSALLAQKGFSADPNILEGEFGYCHQFSGGKVFGLQGGSLDLGENWSILTIGFAFKPYPSCRDTHGCVDGLLRLRKSLTILPDEVESIICKIRPAQARNLRFPDPKSGSEAKFSMPYCIIRAMLGGQLTLEDFQDEAVRDPKVRTLLSKVSLMVSEEKPGEELFTQEVIVRSMNGAEHVCRISEPKGDPKNPITHDELLDKFRDCAKRNVKPEKIDRIIRSIMDFEKLADIKEFMDGLARASS